MAINLPNLRNLVFNKESMGDLGSLGIDLSTLPTIDPGTVTKMPATTTTGAPGSAWWQDAGYPDAATAIQSGNFKYNMNTGWQLKPGATTPAMELAEPVTPEPAFVAPPEVIQSAIENLPVTIGAMTSPDLGPLGTSGMSVFEDEPITMVSDESPMSPTSYSSETPSAEEMFNALANADNEADLNYDLTDVIAQLQNEAAAADTTTAAVDKAVETANGGQGIATGYSGDGFEDQIDEQPPANDIIEEIINSVSVNNTSESDINAAIAAAVAAAQGDGMTEIAAKDAVEKEIASSDAATEAVNAAVGNGQPTTDNAILDGDTQVGTALMSYYYNPLTGETYESTGSLDTPPEGFIPMDENYTPGMGTETPAQPDFMTQLQELIAQMQGEQTAAAEAAAAAEAERQKQAAEMTQNYMVGQPAVGYNPYQSGQYQNNPYGAAGVPDMGGITSIPVPAAYTPNPYLIGGTT